jgi:hypothetical protein
MAASDIIPQYRAEPTHEEITLKAIDLLIEKGKFSDRQKEELKRYREWIKDGSEAEDGYSENYLAPWRPDNHAYDSDSYDPVKKDGVESMDMPQPLIGQKGERKHGTLETESIMNMAGRMQKSTIKNGNKSMATGALAMSATFYRMCLCQAIPFHQ